MLTVFIANCIKISAYKSKKNHIRTHFCILITVLIWRRWRDSNSRRLFRPLPLFESGPFNHLGTSPYMFFNRLSRKQERTAGESITDLSANGQQKNNQYFGKLCIPEETDMRISTEITACCVSISESIISAAQEKIKVLPGSFLPAPEHPSSVR